MTKTAAIAAVIALAVIGMSAFSYTLSLRGPGTGTTGLGGPGTGSLSIYLKDAPPTNSTLRYLLVNVTSLQLRYGSLGSNCSSTATTTLTSTTTTNTTSTNSTSGETSPPEHTFVFQVPANVGTNVNLTSLHGQGLLLGVTSPPAGEVVQVTLNISGAEAFWTDGPPTQLKVVADGKLMIPAHFAISSGGLTGLTIDINPSDIHVSQGNHKVLRPVVLVTVTQSGGCTSSTETTTSSSSSVTSSSTTTSATNTTTSSTVSTGTESTTTNSTSTSTTNSSSSASA